MKIANMEVKRVEAQGWLPIETAPKDGTEVLIRYPLQGNVKKLAHYNTLHKQWQSKGDVIFLIAQKCEWHPLPAPPQAQSTDQESGNG